MKRFLRILLFPVIIVALCAIFFYPTLLSGKLPVPTDTLIGMYHPWLDQAATLHPSGVPFKNFLITDPIRQQIPWRKLVIDDLKNGTLPLWNPYNFSGTPLLANIQAGAWYPLNIIFLFMPFYIAWTILIIIQPCLAALFLYFYLRNKKILPAVAAFAGISWAFCGFSISWLTWGTIVQTALWLPLMLLAVDKVLDNNENKTKILWAGLLAASSAFAFFAGHAQIAFYIFVFAGAYGFRKISWWIIAAAAIAVIVSSIQWVPMLQFISHSARVGDVAAWLKEGWFLPWQHLAQFVAPDFFGNPATLNYWGIWNYGEFVGYVGILPLICAVYAVIVRKDRLTRFFAIALVGIFLFLLPTPIAKIPFEFHIPVLSAMQPTRLMVLVDFCLAVLAALGMDFFLRNADKRIWYGIGIVVTFVAVLLGYALITHLAVAQRNLVLPSLLCVVSSMVLVIALLLKKKHRYWVIGISIVILSFDLFRFGWKFTPFTPVEYFFPETKAISFLRGQQKPFRVLSLDNRILPPNVGAYYGIESIEGYDPIYDARYEEFIAALNRREPSISPPFGFNRIITSPTIDSPLLALLNVKYILSLDELKGPGLELMYIEGQTKIYWYKKALPRIYPVESIIYAGSTQHVMDVLYSSAFDQTRQAVVEEAIIMPRSPINTTDQINIVIYGPVEIRAISNFTDDHFVVIANMYDPGWKAYIDSKLTPIYRTNYLFQGIFVPKGDHTIVVRYQ
jgi:hypothetical protein